MGSQSRRTRKGDRNRKDPIHKVNEAEDIARAEEKKCKAREYKRNSRARIRASLLEASSIPSTTEMSDPSVAPLGSPTSPPSMVHSPLSLPICLAPFPRPPMAPTTIGVHGVASSTAAAVEEHVFVIPTRGDALSLSSSRAADEPTPPSIGSSVRVLMGSSYVEHTPMTSAHVSSPSSPVEDHTPSFLEHGHMVRSPMQHQLSPGYARQPTSSFDGHDHSPLSYHGPPPIPYQVGGESSPPTQSIPDASPSSAAHPTLRSLTRSGVVYRARRIVDGFFADIDIPSRTQVLDALLRHRLLRDSHVAAHIWSPRSRRAGIAVIDSVRRSYMALSRRGSRDALAA